MITRHFGLLTEELDFITCARPAVKSFIVAEKQENIFDNKLSMIIHRRSVLQCMHNFGQIENATIFFARHVQKNLVALFQLINMLGKWFFTEISQLDIMCLLMQEKEEFA